ncbi:MAG TPA: MFS transporter [Acidobacteriaceae bacterium]|jgi:fucose permease
MDLGKRDREKNPVEAGTAGPSILWLGAGILLAGVGTVLLGPLLPFVQVRWHLQDSQAGLLLFFKFIGAFLGGISVPRRLRRGILQGTLLACIGFSLFGMSTGLVTGAITLFISGIGLGQLIASTNILAGRRYTAHTGSALASLNFFWSLGAVGGGLIVAAFLPTLGLRGLLLSIGASLLVVSLGGYLQPRRESAHTLPLGEPNRLLARETILRFGVLLFLYGGLETCLTGWLTTFTMRYTTGPRLLAGQSGTVLLWIALTAGRAISSFILRFVRESVVQRTGLLLSFVFISALATTRNGAFFSLWCLALGVSLAPFFPATYGIFLRMSPTPRQAGAVLAVSGLGAAAFPYLMGVISTHTGSLRLAMVVPMVLALLLFLVSVPRMEEKAAASPSVPARGEYSEKVSA